jgi:hypothetical protein
LLAMASAQAMQISRMHLESGIQVNMDVESDGLFASRLAPTLIVVGHRTSVQSRSSVGAELARDGVSPGNANLPDTPGKR